MVELRGSEELALMLFLLYTDFWCSDVPFSKDLPIVFNLVYRFVAPNVFSLLHVAILFQGLNAPLLCGQDQTSMRP